MEQTGLKPCPFCGKQPEVKRVPQIYSKKLVWKCGCAPWGHTVQIWGSTKSGVIEAWNRGVNGTNVEQP